MVVAGGMEAMSKVPHYMYLRKGIGYGNAAAIDGIIHDGYTDVYNQILMGSCTEKVASEMNITREAQDQFAISSYEKARLAQSSGIFD